MLSLFFYGHVPTGHYWSPYTGLAGCLVDLVQWLFSCRKHHYAKCWVTVLWSYAFRELRKKKPNNLAKTLLLSLMKTDNDIFSNMQLDKLYRHHCKRETQSIPFIPPRTNILTAYRITELEASQEITYISSACVSKCFISVISDRSSSYLF